MSKYTTGELAKLCGTTVRTVQYYDSRGILVPSELSEGGRRLYSESDLQKMKIICFLKDLGLPLKAISQILSEENPGEVILLLMEQQKKNLQEEIEQRNKQVEQIDSLLKELKKTDSISLESIGDAAYTMSNKEKLKEIRTNMVVVSLPITVLQWIGLYYGFFKGVWWILAVWLVVFIPYGILISKYYFKRVAYLCPGCHTVFKPTFTQELFATHTPAARKLTCTHCGYHGYCIEVPIEEVNENA